MIVFYDGNDAKIVYVDRMSIQQIDKIMVYHEEKLGLVADTTRLFR